jgi:hypothetical protein
VFFFVAGNTLLNLPSREDFLKQISLYNNDLKDILPLREESGGCFFVAVNTLLDLPSREDFIKSNFTF